MGSREQSSRSPDAIDFGTLKGSRAMRMEAIFPSPSKRERGPPQAAGEGKPCEGCLRKVSPHPPSLRLVGLPRFAGDAQIVI